MLAYYYKCLYLCNTNMKQTQLVTNLKITIMNARKFDTQKQATEYFGHTWKFIENHYKVSRCYTQANGFRGYFITAK